MQRKCSLVLFFGCSFLVSFACRKNEKDNDQVVQKKGGTLQTVALGSKTKIAKESLSLLDNEAGMPADAKSVFGQSLADGIVSLKYRLSAVTLCGEQDFSKGDTCKSRPLSLFQEKNTNTNAYNTFVPGSADVKSFADWIDFMQKGAVASKFGKVEYSEGHVGKYSSVIVNFYRTFKVNAKVEMNNGDTLYTKASQTFLEGKTGPNPLDITYGSSTKDMTIAPSEEAIFFLPNGGKSFVFQTPFEITNEDLEKQVSFKVALAFDPVNFVKGSSFSPGGAFGQDGWKSGQIDDALGRKIDTNFLEFAPVVARVSETIVRETYLLASPGMKNANGEESGPLYGRLTLYSIKEDPKNSIRAVTGTSFYAEGSTQYMNYNLLGGIRNIAVGSASNLLNFYQGADGKSVAIIKDFKRLVAPKASGTALGEVCLGGFKETGGCSVSLATLQWNYVYLGQAEAETELKIDAVIPTPAPTPEP